MATAKVGRLAAAPVTRRAAGGNGSGDFDVIVVGAGVAGLGAGQKLRLLGLRAVVLEARDHIGGRCYCDNTFPAPFDFGGQLFQQVVPKLTGGTNNPLYDMYIAQGGPDVSCELVPDFCVNGARLPKAGQEPFHDMALAVGAELAVVGAAVSLGASDVSAADASSDFQGQAWYTLTSAVLGLLFNVPASQLSVQDFWDDAKLAIHPLGSPTNKIIPSGMGNFIAQFANGLDIRLSTRVTAIDLTSADRVKVVTDRGPLTAKTVIVTAPTSVLAAGVITFRPALPAAYTQAFADLPCGLVDKIGIAFTSDVFGEIPANTFITRHEDTDSAAKVGKVSARATLAEPIDNRLYFVGEAVSTDSHSSLHGAYLTGQSAAHGIFDHLSGA